MLFRSSLRRRQKKNPGAPPGTLVVDPSALKPVLHDIGFGPDSITEDDEPSLDDVKRSLESRSVTWLNVDGLGSAETLESIGTRFDLHRLALEDVLNVDHRPTVESYGSFFVRCPTDAGSRERVRYRAGQSFPREEFRRHISGKTRRLS